MQNKGRQERRKRFLQTNSTARSEKHSPSNGRKSIQKMDPRFNLQPGTMKANDKGLTYSKSIGAFDKYRGRFDSVSGVHEKKEPSLDALLSRRSASKGIDYMIPHMFKCK